LGNRLFGIVVLVVWSFVAYGQPQTRLQFSTRPVQPAQAKQYVFTHFSSFNGLASNIVNNVIQDSKGYMWLATYDGLQRYDGNKFLTFRHEPGNPKSLPGNVIGKVFEDASGNIWVLMQNHTVGIFNPNDFTFTEVPIVGNAEKDPHAIVLLEQDPEGRAIIYVAKKGIYTFDSRRKVFVDTHPFHLPFDGDHFIAYHYVDRSGQFWFAGRSGLSMYDMRTRNLNYGAHNPDSNEVIRQLAGERLVVNVFGRKGDEFWYVTWNDKDVGAPLIIVHNMITGRKEKYSIGVQFGLGYFELGGALIQRNGRMWVHGKGFLVEYTGGQQPFQLVRNESGEQTIKFDLMFSMYEDREQNIWVSTDNGVYMFNPDAQLFNSYKLVRPDGSGLIEGPAQTALQMPDGSIFVGSWGGGLYYYDSLLNPLPLPRCLEKYKAPYSIWCMIIHSSTGKVWFGLQEGGIIVYDPVQQTAEDFYPPIMEKVTVRTVTEDLQGNLWFGLQRGQIIKWDAKLAGNNPRKGYVMVKGIDYKYIFKIITDNKGYIWAGTIANGLYKYDPVTHKLLDHITRQGPEGHRLMHSDASDVLQYNDSLLLIASGAINVLNLNTGEITYITSRDGLPANPVMCFQKDNEGMLWMGLMHGLCRVNLEKVIFTRYDRRDGLFFDNFFQAGVCRLPDGRLIFLTDHDFFTFNSEKTKNVPPPPQPVFTEFRVANHYLRLDSLHELDAIHLQYNNNTVHIEFSSMTYVRQNKLLYYYMLEGMDKTWKFAGDRLEAVYNYLPPGKYTFRARSENANGVTSAESTLRIIVSPPFWKTWWFYGLVLLIAAGILYWIDRERVNRLVALQKVRSQIAANLHEEINIALSNINLLSEMAKIKADKDILRSKEYIDQISAKSQHMIIAMDDMLWSINPANDSMEKMLLRMREYVEALKNLHGVDLQMVVDEDVRSLRLDMRIRHELFQVFKEILRDMSIRSNDAQLLVNIDLLKSKLYLQVHDISPQNDLALSGLVMATLRKRAAAIGAELDVQHHHKGVSVTLLIPVK